MSVGEWTAVIGLAFTVFVTVVSLIVGAAWWMSALHGQVKGTNQECHDLNEAVTLLTKALESNFRAITGKVDRMAEQKVLDHSELWRAINKLTQDLADVDKRLIRQEKMP